MNICVAQLIRIILQLYNPTYTHVFSYSKVKQYTFTTKSNFYVVNPKKTNESKQTNRNDIEKQFLVIKRYT